MQCPMCPPEDKYAHLLIKKYKYWRVELGCNQVYLAKALIILNRHADDFMDITENERKELFLIGKTYREVVRSLFAPDKFNYAVLGNDVAHVHMHMIPRYKSTREFENQSFTDEKWGRNYSPYDTSFTIPDSTMLALVEKIKSQI